MNIYSIILLIICIPLANCNNQENYSYTRVSDKYKLISDGILYLNSSEFKKCSGYASFELIVDDKTLTVKDYKLVLLRLLNEDGNILLNYATFSEDNKNLHGNFEKEISNYLDSLTIIIINDTLNYNKIGFAVPVIIK